MTKKKEEIKVLNKEGQILGEGFLKKKKSDGKVVIISGISHYSGPLPPADEIKKYSKLHPKFVSILLKDFEKNSDHGRKLLNDDVKFNNKSQDQGFFAVIIMLIMVGLSIYYKQTAIGVSLVGASAFGMIKAILPNKEK